MASKLMMNESIKASEVRLTGLDGENLGILDREEALAMARGLGADLVCESLMSSPPPCRLVAKGDAKKQRDQRKQEERRGDQPAKLKEIRLTPGIEEHDYDTKLRSVEGLLASGHRVQLVVKAQGKDGAKAKTLLERMAGDLAGAGAKETGIQLSGKGAAVTIVPVGRKGL